MDVGWMRGWCGWYMRQVIRLETDELLELSCVEPKMSCGAAHELNTN